MLLAKLTAWSLSLYGSGNHWHKYYFIVFALKINGVGFVVVADVYVSNNFVINTNYSKMQSTLIEMFAIL